MNNSTIYVAIDIVEDQVVRLRQGRLEERTVYGKDPVETATEWERQGAQWLHVIDLDAATRGSNRNSAAIKRILQSVKIPCQVGGGVRSIEAIAGWLESGAARVLVGTKALEPEFLRTALGEFDDKVLPAVDARQGSVRVGGWLESAGATTLETVKRMEQAGASRLMFTDIDRDGTLEGPNFSAIEEVLDAVSVPVIVSGGVDSEHSLRSLSALGDRGLEGVIIGRALYSGALSLEAAHKAVMRV